MSAKRRKQPVSKKKIITITIAVAVVIIFLCVGVYVLRSKVNEEFGSSDSSNVESAEVTTGSISTTVSGSGTLADEDSEEVDIPASIEVTEIFVETGDEVEEGTLLASVNQASVLSAMADVQAEIDTVDAEIAEAADEEIDDTITTSVAGRVKVIYAEADDSVTSVMSENGALMLLSLDGYMAVDVETEELSAGDSVTVTDEDGTEYTGTVDSVVNDTAVILVADSKITYGETVTVTDDGTEIGTGTLYIHKQLAITGYAGTVESISVSLNESVDADDELLTLTDTTYSTNYETLLNEREDYEEELQTLVKIYKEGAIYAEISGTITEATTGSSSDSDTSADAVSTSNGDDGTSTGDSQAAISICPGTTMTITISVDESDILSLSEDQEAEVTIDSLGDETYTGTVTEIETTGSSDSGVTSYTAEITIDKADGMLSGMSASVVITIEGVENALLIPEEALHETSSTAYVYTSYDEDSGEFGDMVEVTVGISNGTYVEITDGLSEGDMVYYEAESDETEDAFGGMNNMGGMGGSSMGDFDMSMPSGDDSSGGRGGSDAMPGGGN